jgi:hypothetical protein
MLTGAPQLTAALLLTALELTDRDVCGALTDAELSALRAELETVTIFVRAEALRRRMEQENRHADHQPDHLC